MRSKIVQIGLEAQGERLDRALADALEADGACVARSALRVAFERGDVRIGGLRAKPSRRIRGPCDVEVELPRPVPLRAVAEAIALPLVFEDEDLLVIDKPAPMVVHASAGHHHGTVVNAVLHHLQTVAAALPTLPGNDATRPGIVHRLDRDTSGVMVVAKTAVAARSLATQFRDHTIERSYLGIVLGVPSWDSKRIESRHGRDPRHRRRFAPNVGTRVAVTDVAVEARMRGAALCRFVLHTGRTHQIRMHARWLGHPIVGDSLYGWNSGEPVVREASSSLSRHALHAAVLGLIHPRTGGTQRFIAELPQELRDLLSRLEG